MGRPRLAASLNVFMNGEEVGRLTASATGQLLFSYADTWLRSDAVRPLSLSLPLSSQAYRGPVVENFFENLLPDSQSIKNRIQARFGAKSNKAELPSTFPARVAEPVFKGMQVARDLFVKNA